MTGLTGPEIGKWVILVGAGPANLKVVTQAARFKAQGISLLLIDPNPFWFFSNMATEVLSGYYALKDFHLDLRILTRQFGVEFIQDEVVSLLPEKKKIMTKAGRILEYDQIAFAIGSVSAAPEVEVPAEGRFTVNPIKNVLQIRNEIETTLELFTEKVLEVVVLGAGPSGLEYALNVAELLADRKPKAGWSVTLLDAQPRILAGFPLRAANIAEKICTVYDIKIRTKVEVQHVQSNRLVLEFGETLSFDVAIVAMGERTPDLFLHAGLDIDSQGSLRVERSLNIKNHPEIFATGDCARIKGQGVHRTSANAIQAASVLVHNLLAPYAKKPRQKYSGPEHSARFISLGRQTAMVVKGPWVWEGAWVLGLKHWLDRRFMRQVKQYRT